MLKEQNVYVLLKCDTALCICNEKPPACFGVKSCS